MKKINYVLALVVGVVVGWLIDWLMFRKQLQGEAAVLRNELQIAQAQAKDMERKVEAHSAEVKTLRDKLIDAQNEAENIAAIQAKLASAAAESAALSTQLEQATSGTTQDHVLGEPDDLARINGIGPKTKAILYENGVLTFAHLASGSAEEIADLLKESGFKGVINTETWPEQAALAANGDWDKLQALQAQLDGGRRRKETK